MSDEDSNWFVYMIRASDDSLYTGKGGAKYFRGRQACDFVFTESGHSRSSASVREAQIKKMTRKQKNLLL